MIQLRRHGIHFLEADLRAGRRCLGVDSGRSSSLTDQAREQCLLTKRFRQRADSSVIDLAYGFTITAINKVPFHLHLQEFDSVLSAALCLANAASIPLDQESQVLVEHDNDLMQLLQYQRADSVLASSRLEKFGAYFGCSVCLHFSRLVYKKCLSIHSPRLIALHHLFDVGVVPCRIVDPTFNRGVLNVIT